jgi:hypothetical protein
MKNENQESLNLQNRGIEGDNLDDSEKAKSNHANGGSDLDEQNRDEEKNSNGHDPVRQARQNENQNDEIDYSSFDIDESTGGSAMEEFEED